MQMKLNKHAGSEHVGFINYDYVLMCVRPPVVHLINMDFFFIRINILNFICETEFRTFSKHCF